jgi:hypothetical protein
MSEEEKKRVPGYPQDMMIMDDEVAKPEIWGLAPGWTASMMGMMTLVRVLPPDKYDKIMAMIKEGKKSAKVRSSKSSCRRRVSSLSPAAWECSRARWSNSNREDP